MEFIISPFSKINISEINDQKLECLSKTTVFTVDNSKIKCQDPKSICGSNFSTCPSKCKIHGKCLANGDCLCNAGYSGSQCDVLDKCEDSFCSISSFNDSKNGGLAGLLSFFIQLNLILVILL